MKIEIKLSSFLFTVFLMLISSSCRTEFNEEIYAENEQNQSITANSKSANLISKVTLNDGSIDDILDESSCFVIKLPVTITINNIDITINSAIDYAIIEGIINESDIDFFFPITIISNDFLETIIENYTQLQVFINNCDDNEENIECIDFKYPFSMAVFNQNTELLRNVTFNNDNKLHRFITKLDESDIVAIDFPITLVSSDGIEIMVNTLDELENTIEDASDNCDEDDDASPDLFTQLITSQLFEVQKFKDNQSNETKNYKGYVFDFNTDGTVQVTIDGSTSEDNTTNGTWSVITRADGGLNTTLDFGTEAPLNKLNKEWNVKQTQENRIMLDDRNDDEISKDQLFFKKV